VGPEIAAQEADGDLGNFRDWFIVSSLVMFALFRVEPGEIPSSDANACL